MVVERVIGSNPRKPGAELGVEDESQKGHQGRFPRGGSRDAFPAGDEVDSERNHDIGRPALDPVRDR